MLNAQEDELKKVPFDSKIGFTIRNLSLEDSNRYKCSIEKDGKEHVVNYVLSVCKCGLETQFSHTPIRAFFIYDLEKGLS